VSSANLSGLPAATEAAAAEGMLGDSVEVVLDGGPSPKGEASTILDVRLSQPRLLRLGALSVAAINDVIQPLGATVIEDDED
jgi:tRNA A37 threonylcarbamoyladenosine synthetase subunit TsaC/SUA5/YrdC